MSDVATETKLTKKDFTPDNEPRWCPGCGDYAILNTIQKVFPNLGIPKENFVVVSGIGCSSRFPYYMNTYGFHTLHGRAPTVATGIKAANPDLSVWMVTGDGDGLSIGGNHLMHVLRKNPDIKILLFNNRIYGLTKGQYSPTSDPGTVTKSSPLGSIEAPINPLSFAIASQASFIARTLDNNPKHMTQVFEAAAAHKGLAFIEIFQNCVIFNNKTFDPVYAKENRSEQMLFLEDQQPMIYGAESDKGITINGTRPQIVSTADGAPIVHDVKNEDSGYAYALAQMTHPNYPTPVGIFRAVERPTYEGNIHGQIAQATAKKGKGKLDDLILGGDYWEVKDDGEREVNTMGRDTSSAIQDEQIISRERSQEAKRYANDPISKVFNTRIEEIIAVFGQPKASKADHQAPISDVIKIMKLELVSSVVITKDDEICGIFTERDVLFKVIDLIDDLESTPISDVMTPSPETSHSWQSVAQALHALGDGGYRHLPVIREKGKLGVITTKGIMHYLHKEVLNHDH